MKKQFIGVFAIAFGLLLTACGPSQAELDEMEAELDAEFEQMFGDDESEEEVEATLEISAEMADFVASIDGTSDGITGGLTKYGANSGVTDHDMGFYDLKSPEITAQDGNCYSLTCIAGAIENYYTICWEDGKIVSVKETM
jgi:hypothetical protein